MTVVRNHQVASLTLGLVRRCPGPGQDVIIKELNPDESVALASPALLGAGFNRHQ
jgi:hypothetical protein